MFVLGLWGGSLADRGDKRAILVATQVAAMLQALALAGLTLSGLANVWLVAGLAMVLGAVNAVDMPTRQSFVVEMVGKEDLHNAIALNSSMFNSARIIGPALAGLLVAAIGEGWCFLGNALSYLAVIASLTRMRLPAVVRAAPGSPRTSPVADALVYAWRDRPMRAILLGLTITSLFGATFMVLMPVMVDAVLGHGARGLGFILAATGLGSVVAALLLAVRRESRGLDRLRVAAGLGFGLFLLLFAASRAYWLSVLLAPGVGFCLIFYFAASNTLLQLRSPDGLRGRIMALYAVTLVGMAPFGSLFSGALASLVGAPAAIAVSGGICLAGIAGIALFWPTAEPPRPAGTLPMEDACAR